MVGNFVAEAFLAKIIVIVGADLVGGSFLSENHERGVDGDAREPSCETGPAVKVRQVNKGPQEAVLHCVFRIFAISHHSMNDTENLFAMAFAKFSKGGSSSSFRGCYQLVLAPLSKIANLWGIVLHQQQCPHHHD